MLAARPLGTLLIGRKLPDGKLACLEYLWPDIWQTGREQPSVTEPYA